VGLKVIKIFIWVFFEAFLLTSTMPVWAEEEAAPAAEQKAEAPAGAPANDLEAGEAIYRKRCIFCHGDEGAGDGVASERLVPKPRDFTMGLYKYRTTGSGLLPTDDDLFKVISHGLPGTGMPAWDDTLSEPQRRQVIQYIKTFSKRFERQKEPLQTITVGPEIASSPESIEKGKTLFKEMECFKCHGTDGRGDGPSAPELQDDKGDPIKPRNLTKNWLFRGGGEARDIYMRFNTGLNGTPMPSFADSLDNEKSWHLANYVRSLSPPTRPALDVTIKALKVAGDVPINPGAPEWQQAEERLFPMIGQVVRHERMFAPTVSDVRVTALYNETELGLRVVWDDPSASKNDEALASFEDALAIQFPVTLNKGTKKPYFVAGDAKLPVNLWTWKTEAGSFIESNSRGIDQETIQADTSQALKGSGKYNNGQYQVVMKRSLKTADAENDLQVVGDTFIPVAFHAWDGSNGETLTKRAISHWYFVLLASEIDPKLYAYPVGVFVLVVGALLGLQGKLRKNQGKGK
jgi:DMSO reductase family type II enzyme heme b subunit